ncbi:MULTISPECIES: hypothetical protein [Bacillus]|nr:MULTISPECIES: hypothetical protein [Bacillus]QHZ47819.1 hypothetical protein M654_016735 [Bacillus sp. NSP9.1]
MKKLLFTIGAFCIASALSPISAANALNIQQLPVKQKTDQWTVEIGKAKEGKNLAKAEQGKYQTYSVKVQKIGRDIASAEIHLFRNDPHSETKYSLFGKRDERRDHKEEALLAKSLNNGTPVSYSNILVAEKASELEVDILWTEKGTEGRMLKETFTFTSNARN